MSQKEKRRKQFLKKRRAVTIDAAVQTEPRCYWKKYMKKIYDRPIVMEYVKKYGISRFFDTRDLPFFLIRYEKGETIIPPTEHTRYLQTVRGGSG